MELKRHEKSLILTPAVSEGTRNRLQKVTLTYKIIDKNFNKEVEHWDNVMKRLISLTIIMAKQNLPFRGSCVKVHQDYNKNFLKILEFLAEFNPVMEKHLLRAKQKPNSVHLSKDIQNEIIDLIGKSIKSKLLKMSQSPFIFKIS